MEQLVEQAPALAALCMVIAMLLQPFRKSNSAVHEENHRMLKAICRHHDLEVD